MTEMMFNEEQPLSANPTLQLRPYQVGYVEQFLKDGSITIVQTEPELRILEEVVAREDAAQRRLALLDARTHHRQREAAQ